MPHKNKIMAAAGILGYAQLREGQSDPINALLDGHDCLVIYPTSYGKSAIMQVPALTRPNALTLIFEPTVSLMYDQVIKLQNLGVKAEYLAHRNKAEHPRIYEKVCNGEVTILYAAPERYKDLSFRHAIWVNEPWLVVIDEAHCYVEWGEDFRPDFRKIPALIGLMKEHPVILAMTATAPVNYRKTLASELAMKDPGIFTTSLARPNLSILVKAAKNLYDFEDRCRQVYKLIEEYGKDGRTVIYCATVNDTSKCYNYLAHIYEEQLAKCNSFMDEKDREECEFGFISGRSRIMVATTAFGMGVDVPDIRLVIHFSLPMSPIQYYQQIGRAGRDGERSRCVLLYHETDDKRFGPILDAIKDKKVRDRKRNEIERMKQIVTGDSCIMQELLKAVDDIEPRPCGHCSVCQKKRNQK